MTAQLITAALALTLLTILPGPDVAVVTRAAISSGRGGAARAAFGIAGGLLVWGALSVAGLAALLAASTTAYTVVRLAGALYLVWLGLQTLWRARRPYDEELLTTAGMRNPGRAGFLTNVLNPKIAIFYTGLLPQLVPDGIPHTLALMLLVAMHITISTLWLVIYGTLVGRAADVMRRPAVRRALDGFTGAVFVGFGVRVAAASHR